MYSIVYCSDDQAKKNYLSVDRAFFLCYLEQPLKGVNPINHSGKVLSCTLFVGRQRNEHDKEDEKLNSTIKFMILKNKHQKYLII